mgnify:FL=1
MTTIPSADVQRLQNALPFWLSLAMIPVAVLSTLWGGWAVLALPLYAWGMFSLLDAVTGRNEDNADLTTPE